MPDESESGPQSTVSNSQLSALSDPVLQEKLREVAISMYDEMSLYVGESGELGRDSAWLSSCVQRLEVCCAYHWERMSAGGEIKFDEVRDRLLQGRLSRATLQANLLFDIVLAAALQANDIAAVLVFQQNYMPLVRAIASRVAGERAVAEVENFVAELILTRGESGPRISKYSGKTSLACWLRAVVYNFCVSKLRETHSQEFDDSLSPAEDRVDDSSNAKELSECESLLRPLFVRAVQSLDDQSRLLLKSLILDGVSQTKLANLLGLHKGTLTRRRQAAEKQLWEHLAAELEACENRTRAHECIGSTLAGDDQGLRLEVANLLADAVRADDSSAGAEKRTDGENHE